MKKEFRVCKNYEFSSIIEHRVFGKSESFVCYVMDRKENHARIGISVGKKIGNAVQRNKVKRQVRSMVDHIFSFEEAYDTIIIVRPSYLKHSYAQNYQELEQTKKKIEKRISKKRVEG